MSFQPGKTVTMSSDSPFYDNVPSGYLYCGAITIVIMITSPTIMYWLRCLFDKLCASVKKNITIRQRKKTLVPVSVNFHFSRKCNYQCGFCFHTAKDSYVAPIEDAMRALRLLASLGMKKLNLSGGEPFLYPKFLGEICKFAKTDLKLESVSIVSNGSKILESFFKKYAEYVDILAISVDSFDEETNRKIGRGVGQHHHLNKMHQIAEWCRDYHVLFKLNTVVNRFNVNEDFTDNITALDPVRWKCFQVLAVDTENKGEDAKRDVTPFLISDEEYQAFCDRHSHLKCFVKESNFLMKSSYIILDEQLRFLSKGDNYYTSRPIIEPGVDIMQELATSDYDHQTFIERNGIYDWSKKQGCGSELPEKLQF